MVRVFMFDPVKIPSMTPTLGRAELLSKLLSKADTPKSFRSRSSRADSVTQDRDTLSDGRSRSRMLLRCRAAALTDN